MSNFDLENHAADKVKRALDDVYQLTDDPGLKMRIAIMASSICIGAAGGFLAGKAKRKGFVISEKDAMLQIMELVKLMAVDGPEAVLAKLNMPSSAAAG